MSVVLRRYKLGGLGLWSSAKAAGNVSAGAERELLASPMVLRIDDGKVLEGKGRFVDVKPNRAVFEGKAEAESVVVTSRCVVEVDGCMKVELTLAPGKGSRPLKALWLEVPLKDAEAPLWHLSTTACRMSPAGETPKGEGVVWSGVADKKKYLPPGAVGGHEDEMWRSNFNPYLWLGAEERGLCWFADNDAGWELDPKGAVPCQELIRKDGVLTFVARLVQTPVTLAGPRTITFGLQASPVKPMSRADWRRITVNSAQKKRPKPRLDGLRVLGGGHGLLVEISPQPRPRRPRRHARRPVREGRGRGGVETEVRGAGPAPPGETFGVVAWKTRALILDLLGVSVRMAANCRAGNYFTVYWDEMVTVDGFHEELRTFRDEWSGGWACDLPKGTGCPEFFDPQLPRFRGVERSRVHQARDRAVLRQHLHDPQLRPNDRRRLPHAGRADPAFRRDLGASGIFPAALEPAPAARPLRTSCR